MSASIPASRWTLALVAPLFAALALAGCSGLLQSEQPAKRYYLLQPLGGSAAGAANPGGPDAGVVVTPVPGLDTDRLQALGADAHLSGYANARWPEHLPELLSSLLARSLEAGGGFRSVTAGATPAEPGWSLQLEVREFYGILDGAGQTASVRVSLAGTVRCGGGEHPLRAAAERRPEEQRLEAIVRAHQLGLDEATRQLADGISAACSAPGSDR